MTVYIMRMEIADQFYIVDQTGAPVSVFLFGSYEEAETYCEARSYTIGRWEEGEDMSNTGSATDTG